MNVRIFFYTHHTGSPILTADKCRACETNEETKDAELDWDALASVILDFFGALPRPHAMWRRSVPSVKWSYAGFGELSA